MNKHALWTAALVLAGLAIGPWDGRHGVAAVGPGPELEAMLELQAAAPARITNGRCTGECSLWIDHAAMKGADRPEVYEDHTVYSLIEFIGLPGGPLRLDSTADPLLVNGEAGPEMRAARSQVYWDTKQRLSYMPAQRHARIEATSPATWADAHPLSYGLIFWGGTLRDAIGQRVPSANEGGRRAR
jgi:hypothetical protein